MPDPRTVAGIPGPPSTGLCACTWGYRCPYHRPDPTGDQPPMPTLHDAVRAALGDACTELKADLDGPTVFALADATADRLELGDWALFHVEPGQMHYQAPAIPGDPDLEFLALATQQLDLLANSQGVHAAARAARYLADRYAPEADT